MRIGLVGGLCQTAVKRLRPPRFHLKMGNQKKPSSTFRRDPYMTSKHPTVPRRTFVTGAAALAALSALGPASAFADEVSDAQAALDSANAAAADKQAQAEAALSSLNAMQDTLDQASDEYQEALDAQQDAQNKMDEAQQQIDESTAKIEELQGKISTRVRGAYRTGGSTFLDVLTGSSSFEEFATGLDLLDKMSKEDAQLVASVKDERATQQAAYDEYESQKEIADQKAAEAEQKKNEAEALVAQYQQTYDSLSAEVQQLIEQKRQAQEDLNAAQAQARLERAAAPGRGRRSRRPGPGRPAVEQLELGFGLVWLLFGVVVGLFVRFVFGQRLVVEGAELVGVVFVVFELFRSDVVSRAYSCLGKPYVWGAVGPDGYDCSGLVSYCISGRHTRIGTASSFTAFRP